MDTVDPYDAERAFAALLHRVASPLGAIANYAHLLSEEEAPEARQGILDAMASARGTLRDAQRWLDAVETTRAAVPGGGVNLADELRAAAERCAHGVRITAPALPRVAVPHAAAMRLADALLDDAAAGGADELRIELAPGEAVHLVIAQAGRVWSEAEATRAFDLFSPRDSGSNDCQGELAVAGSLARRLGGRAWGTVGPGGEAVLHLALPAGQPHESTDEERQDA